MLDYARLTDVLNTFYQSRGMMAKTITDGLDQTIVPPSRPAAYPCLVVPTG